MSNDELTNYSSTGHRFANASFIDAHYAVCRQSYETMVRAVGIQPGWHVLDAGCGSGSFLPIISELVTSQGMITAIDIDPEHVQRVRARADQLPTPIDVYSGSVTKLPFADHSFDAIWNANVCQYLDDTAFASMLGEFVRVVKPGGLVAIKESDPTALQVYPLDTFIYWRYCERLFAHQPGFRRIPTIPHWMSDAGLVAIHQKTYLEEIRAPLTNDAHVFMAGALRHFAQEAEEFGLPESDLVRWRQCREPSDPNNPVHQHDFYFREGCTLAIGAKPNSVSAFGSLAS